MNQFNAIRRGAADHPASRCQRCWRTLVTAMVLVGATQAFAADTDADMARAEQLVREGSYQEAVTLYEHALDADPDSVDAHLGLARAYLALGDYASAKIEFETVLRFDNLPADLHQQVEIYADAAESYAEGKRLLPFGYAIAGFGNYSVNDTAGTDAFGGGDTDDNFFNARGGGGLNYELDDGYSLNGTLDYRYRNYDNGDRRDDKDLRWNGAVSRVVGDGNIAVGVRGRNSYRGNGDYRNDYGVYGDYRYRLDADNQVSVGAEVRRRQYPNGPLRQRSRDIVELTSGWTRSLLDGKASFSLSAFGGREFETHDRPDGDSNFFGLSPSLNFTLTEELGGFVFAWWQHERYNDERFNIGPDDEVLGIKTRTDDLYEVGGGLTWEFKPSWSLNPEILYIHDDSNILASNYSSTELWITVRRDF